MKNKKTIVATVLSLAAICIGAYYVVRFMDKAQGVPVSEMDREELLTDLSKGVVAEPVDERRETLNRLEASSTDAELPSVEERVRLLESLK